MPVFRHRKDEDRTRTERIAILIELDKSKADTYREQINQILRSPGGSGTTAPDMSEGDTLKVKYSFTAEYFGEITDNLKTLQSLMSDPDIVVSATVSELVHNECLIEEVLRDIRRVKSIVEERERGRRNPPR